MARRVLILGGTGDIGQAIARAFPDDEVVAVGSQDVDLSEGWSVRLFAERYGTTFDTIVHCAGFNEPEDFETLGIDKLEHTVQANLLGFLPLIKANIPHWRNTGTGRLIVISSIYGFFARRGRLAYVISKHGLVGAVKTLAIELAPLGCMVNAVSPGYINTKMTSKNNTPETVAKLTAGIPVGRLGSPEEIAYAVKFLASEDNTYITGQDIVVDGGYSAGGFQGT